MKHSIFKILNNASLLFFIFLYTFYVNGQTISSFSPTTGPIGTIVTITGTGFDNTPTNNIVFFGATAATVSAASATSLTATVPTGANYQYITATNIITNLTAYSDKPFIVTTICNSATTFAPAISVQGGSHNVEIYDMDGDGKADLIIPDYFNNYFTVTRNTSTPGSISFAAKVTFPWAAGGQPNEVSIGDFDGDGKPDVALGGNGGGAFVSVYRNTSTCHSRLSFLFHVDLNVLAVFLIHDIDDLAGHARTQSFHYIGHIHAFDFRGEVRADLHAGIHQRERNLDGGFRSTSAGVCHSDAQPARGRP